MNKLKPATDYVKSFYISYLLGTTEEVRDHHDKYYAQKTSFGVEYAWLGMIPETAIGIVGLAAFPPTFLFVLADTGVRAFTMADRFWEGDPPIGLVGLLREKNVINLR